MEIKDKDKVINESKEKIERLKGYIELDKKEKRLEDGLKYHQIKILKMFLILQKKD